MSAFPRGSPAPRPVVVAGADGPQSRIDLGPLAEIVSNYLRTRPDLVPDVEEWLAPPSQGSADAIAFSTIRGVLAEDLGQAVEAVYSWIDPLPLRKGPLSQIHVAQTTTGHEVAIKVRRPDAADLVSRALPALQRSMEVLARRAGLPATSGSELTQGLRDWLDHELDAARELANLERLHSRVARDEGFVIPRPRHDLSSPRVVVFELRRGTPLDELARDIANTRSDQASRLEFDRVELGTNLLKAVLHQIFVAETFVSSLAPEYLLATAGNRISFLDFSHVERIDPIVRRNQYRYVAAIGAVDVERMLGGVAELAESPDNTASEAFATGFRHQMREWEHDPDWETTRGARFADCLIDTLRLARRHGLRFEGPVLTLARTLVVADGLAKPLSVRTRLGTVAAAFFLPRWLAGFAQEVWQQQLPSVGFDIVDLLTDAPGNLVRVLSDIADRRFVLRVQAQESEETRHAAAMRSRLLATSALIIGVTILAAALLVSGSTSLVAWTGVASVGALVLLLFGVLWRRLG